MLLASLAVFDERVRTLLPNSLTSDSFGGLWVTITRGQHVVQGAYASVSQSPEHASLALMVLVGGGLLLLMTRS